MIIDQLQNAHLYRNIHPRITAALDALTAGQIQQKDDGRYEIDVQKLFALVQTYQTRDRREAKFEAHRRYIDVQFVVDGQEEMGWADAAGLRITDPYAAEKDIYFGQAVGESFIRVPAGWFIIFFPHDAHMPNLTIDTPIKVKKVVLKCEV